MTDCAACGPIAIYATADMCGYKFEWLSIAQRVCVCVYIYIYIRSTHRVSYPAYKYLRAWDVHMKIDSAGALAISKLAEPSFRSVTHRNDMIRDQPCDRMQAR